jgi:2-keto-3-deoxy-L-rhamnonate aldolase RhmA
VIEVSDQIFAAAKRHRVPVGFHTPTPEYANMVIEKGVQLVWAGSDVVYIRAGVDDAMKRIKRKPA